MSMQPKHQKIGTVIAGSTQYEQHTSIFPVLNRKGWKRYFSKVCNKLQLLPYVIKAFTDDKAQLHVTTINRDAMKDVQSILEKEIQTFIKNKPQSVTSWSSSNMKKQRLKPPPKRFLTNRLTTDDVRKPNKLKNNTSHVLRVTLQKTQKRSIKHTRRKPVRIKKRNESKLWYKRNKNVKKTKAILKYIRQEIKYRRRHHHRRTLYQQQKRSPFEYRQKKTIGRQRDKLKAKRVKISKGKFKPNRVERKVLSPYKHMTTNGYHNAVNNISIIQNENSVKCSRKKTSDRISYGQSLVTAFTSARSLKREHNKILVHYSNQYVFIYALPSNHHNRPSKKYLIKTFSTINNIPSERFDKVDHVSRSNSDVTNTVEAHLCNRIVHQSKQSTKPTNKKKSKRPTLK